MVTKEGDYDDDHDASNDDNDDGIVSGGRGNYNTDHDGDG